MARSLATWRSGPGYDFLVSQKFREVYFQHGLTGLVGFDPVEIIKVKSKSRRKILSRSPMYFRVRANYGGTALDLAASGMEWLEQPTCSECYTATIVRWKRLVVKEDTWTGDDIFRPRGMSGEVMVTRRFKEACLSHGITNAVFMPGEKACHDFYPGLVTGKFRAPQ
jgi:hypothetical protein